MGVIGDVSVEWRTKDGTAKSPADYMVSTCCIFPLVVVPGNVTASIYYLYVYRMILYIYNYIQTFAQHLRIIAQQWCNLVGLLCKEVLGLANQAN